MRLRNYNFINAAPDGAVRDIFLQGFYYDVVPMGLLLAPLGVKS